jgi:hypothetical protein
MIAYRLSAPSPEADMTSAVRAPILAVAVAALVCGCATSGSPTTGTTGSAAALTKPTASTLVDQVASAVTQATSVHMAGSASSGGQTFQLNLNMTKSGGISGTISLGSAAAGFTFLKSGRKVYFKVTAGFMKIAKLPSAACALMCGKWLMETGPSAKNMTGDLTWSGFTGSMAKPPAGAKVSGPVTVDGIQTWVITTKSDGTFYVAAHGTPYPVRGIAPHGNARIDFSDWNTAVIPPPPPAKDVVDLSQLSKLG